MTPIIYLACWDDDGHYFDMYRRYMPAIPVLIGQAFRIPLNTRQGYGLWVVDAIVHGFGEAFDHPEHNARVVLVPSDEMATLDREFQLEMDSIPGPTGSVVDAETTAAG